MTRRRFLAGTGTLGLLAACGQQDDGAHTPQLVSLFSGDHVIAAGLPQRIPFAVIDTGDAEDRRLADAAELPVRVLLDGKVIDELTVRGRIVEHDHVGDDVDPSHEHADLLRYYPLRAELPTVGIYDLEVDFGQAGIARLPVQAFDPADISVVMTGQPMPALATPTSTSSRGVRPVCTRSPEPCPFHEVSLDDALKEGRALAVLIATPALCSTAYCGPVLETLITEAVNVPDVTPIHLEVYANADDVGGNYADPSIELAPSIGDLGLEFEPSLFLVDRDGVVVDRIDNLFDQTELQAALATISST